MCVECARCSLTIVNEIFLRFCSIVKSVYICVWVFCGFQRMVSASLDIDISSKILQYIFENSLLFAGKQGRKPGF